MIISLFKTKTDFTATPKGKRYTVTGRIYVEVRFPIISGQQVKPQGRYYIVDSNGVEHHLSDFTGFHTADEITAIENAYLPDFTNTRNTFAVLYERIPQFALLTIQMEHAENNDDNYGITDDDLELVTT